MPRDTAGSSSRQDTGIRTQALAGVRVVEFGQWIAGPSCGALLADFGADVIKIEKPGQGDDQRHSPPFLDGDSALFIQLNRGKRSVVLDLANDEDLARASRLVSTADVVIDNFRVGVLDLLGLGYERVKQLNPRAVYCGISGFGSTGSLSKWAGMDLIAQAMSGVMRLNRDDEDRPLRIPFAVADLSTGLFACIGVLTALMARQHIGKGQFVDVSLLDSLLAMFPYETSHLAATGNAPDRFRKVSSGNAAPYQVYRTRDGWMVIVAVTQALWLKLCTILGSSELADDPRYASNATRIAHAAELQQSIECVLTSRTTAEWIAAMHGAGIPCAPVLSLPEMVRHPHSLIRGIFTRVADPNAGRASVVAAPIEFSETPVALWGPAPRLGEQSDAIKDALAASPDWPGRIPTMSGDPHAC